ncbi:Gfo/Idh/MocA family oxidoreductase [Marinilongibacter aquaticus]|uniref:Gfo/Idh/MocA family protein n=1 Tax=Marinilongibacter aquaticus TaxID=2975157 RepID=UPI0021BDC7BE|nr:Gfo/Idh/MocA family oxidoreductase [Marinilongibacter aquaticus]UBM59926.1 Gfo/Idh/MocA family oxidoreductase [Marinilongibacter aquaticus]
MKNSRRDFIKTSALGLAGVTFSAKSYSRILGANERINLAHAGLNSRMGAHLSASRSFKNILNHVALCDVDKRTFAKTKKRFSDIIPADIKEFEDIRKMLENKDIDAITVASPDHWHAPMGIMAMQAGKHVYLEKPCCHNPQEGEWLIETQKKSGKKLQIGNQQRSAPTSIEVVKLIHEGIIGNAYYAKTIYENNRGSIGVGKTVPVPEWLNWDLYQGPAPRREFKDNIVHYNWHWFWNWGTGEISNNGLHEMDFARLALGVSIPNQVSSAGGRFAFDDDWEFFDTQLATFNFPENKMIDWEGRSCNGNSGFKGFHGRGTQVFGTEGCAFVDRGGYKIYNKAGDLIKEAKEGQEVDGTDTTGISGLDQYHFKNFFDAIRLDTPLNSPIAEAHKSTLLCHLGNMAQKLGKTLKVDSQTGKPEDKEAQKMWGREYDKEFKPKV